MRNWGKIVDKRSCSKTNRVLEQAHLLKKGGCKSIYLFGSLAAGKNHEDSDIDIGIKGLPKGKFFEICSKVYFAVDNNIDIVDFDSQWGRILPPSGRLELVVPTKNSSRPHS